VAARYVARDEPCLPDKATPRSSTPDPLLRRGRAAGTVTVEARSTRPEVVKTTVTTNSTGSERRVVAAGELERCFSPRSAAAGGPLHLRLHADVLKDRDRDGDDTTTRASCKLDETLRCAQGDKPYSLSTNTLSF